MANNIKIILIHVFIGTSIFYFLVHPFTMVLYWFEFSHTKYTFSLFQEVFKSRLLESFSFSMMGMSSLLTGLGGLLGLVSGLFWINFKKKKTLLKKQEHLLKRDITKLIDLGENEQVEFKSSIRYDYFQKTSNKNLELVIAKTIVGFMNANGGKLIIGVKDEGEVIGLEKDFKTLKQKNKDGHERKIYEIISSFIGHDSCFKSHVSYYDFDGKQICLVDVEPSSNPVYLSENEDTSFYVRTGNATYPLSVKDTVKYLKSRET